MKQPDKSTSTNNARPANLFFTRKSYGVPFDEIVKAVIHSDGDMIEMLTVSKGWHDLNQRMFEEYQKREVQRYTPGNVCWLADVFLFGFKRRFRAQAETDKTIVSF